MEPIVLSYEEMRNRVKDGDIIFFKSKRFKLVPAIIGFFTRSKFYHVGIAFWAEMGGKQRLLLAEATGKAKRRIVNLSFYQEYEMHVIQSPKDWTEYSDNALSKLGEVPYGIINFIYIGLREFLLIYTKYINLPRLNLPGEVCSEYVSRVLDLVKQNISPQMLKEQLHKLGFPVKYIGR